MAEGRKNLSGEFGAPLFADSGWKNEEDGGGARRPRVGRERCQPR